MSVPRGHRTAGARCQLRGSVARGEAPPDSLEPRLLETCLLVSLAPASSAKPQQKPLAVLRAAEGGTLPSKFCSNQLNAELRLNGFRGATRCSRVRTRSG